MYYTTVYPFTTVRLACRLLFFLSTSLVIGSGFAQPRFHKIATAQGLSQSSVVAMVQDRRGFLWFGTADGLNRYDGYGFTVYRHQPRDSASLPSSDISALAEDGSGQLWVGTVTGGVCYLDPRSGRFVRVALRAAERPTTLISSIVAGGTDVWVGSDAAGLFHIDTRTGTARWLYWEGGPILEPNVTALATGSGSTCWAATAGGIVYQIAKQPFRSLRRLVLPLAPGSNRINALLEDSRHRLWIATEAGGLYRLDPGDHQPRRVWYVPGQIGGTNSILAFAEDGQRNLWIGTDNGVLMAPGGDLTHPQHYRYGPDSEHGLSSHAVKSLLTDRSGNVWIGTWEAGLNVVYRQSERFRTLTYRPGQPNGLLSGKVTAIGGDPRGGLWLGSNLGLTYWLPARNRFEAVRPPQLDGQDVNVIYNQPTDRPLVGVWNRAFAVRNPRTRRFDGQLGRLAPDDTVPNNSTQAFCRAGNGQVWIATTKAGLLRFDPVTQRSTAVESTAGGAAVRWLNPNALCETADQTLWMGMFNDGLWAYDLRSRRTRHYRAGQQPGDLSENHILVLFEDAQKRLWIGTNGGGLNRFDPKTNRFAVYTTDDGLASNIVKGILEDRRGNLWLSTNDGLSMLDSGGRTFTNFTTYDGLPGREFLTGSCYQSPDGHLYFGSMNGLVYFHPDSLTPSRDPLPTYLTGLRLFNRAVTVGGPDSPLQQPLSETEQLTLRHDQSVFTIDFLALNVRAAPNIRYAYRLDNFDPDWNYVGSQRSATYTNLDPGTYVFQVKAANGTGPWQASGARLTIRIRPPWYRTGWAYALYALTLATMLWGLRRLIKIRERFRSDLRIQTMEAEKMRELDRLKTNFFTNISHEFRTPLTLIVSPLEQLLGGKAPTDPGAMRQQHGLMYRNAQRLLRLINQLLDLSKLEAGQLRPSPQANTLPEFVERLVGSFEPTAGSHGQSVSVNVDFRDDPVWYDPDLLEKVLSNLLSNALKFTPDGGRIEVSLRSAADGFAEISVQDSGVGIPPEHLEPIFDRFYQVDGQTQQKAVGTGVGLALTKELIELVGGTIDVVSTVGKGSTFTVRFPVHAPVAEPSPPGSSQSLAERRPLETEPLPTAVPVSRPAHKPTLLVVEDNDDLRSYITSIFAGQYTIIEAANGLVGWQRAQETNPDLVISDLMMPDMDGLTLCRRVKTDAHTSHIPFVLLTARQNTDSQLDGFSAGADDYVVKPFNAQLLESRVRNLLRSRRLLRERFGRVLTVQPSALTTTSADEQFLTQVLQVVELHLGDAAFGLKDLEDAMNVSETLLYRKLKTLTGLSGNEFIRSIRLKRAAQWLQSEADLTVSEVAYRVGFRDPAYFTRCFTKEFGQSPKQFAAAVS